jgi:hypothetical protein
VVKLPSSGKKEVATGAGSVEVSMRLLGGVAELSVGIFVGGTVGVVVV